MRILQWLLFAIVALAFSAAAVSAQQPAAEAPALTKQELEALVEQAGEKGVQIIVVAPKDQATEAPEQPVAGTAGSLVARVRAELRNLAAEAPSAPGRIWAGLAQASPDGTVGHHAVVALVVIGIMLVAAFLERFYGAWLKSKMRAIWPTALTQLPEKMCFLLMRFVGRLVGFGLFAIVAIAAAAAVFEEHPSNEATALFLVFTVVIVRSVVEFWRVWISPNLAEFRLPPLGDAEAERLFRWLAAAAILSGGLLSFGLWLDTLVADRRAVIVAQLVLIVVILVINLIAIAAIRRTVAGLIAGSDRTHRLRSLLGANWHVLMGLYLLAAWVATSARTLLEQPDRLGPGFGMILILAGTLTLYSVGVVLLDWIFYRRQGAPHRKAQEAAAAAAASGAGGEGPPPGDAISEDRGEPAEGWFGGVRSFEDLAKQSLNLVLFIFVISGLMIVWGVDVTDDDSPFVRLWDVIFVIFAGYVAMQSARIWIRRKIEAEGGFEEPEPGEEGAAGGVSRLATLLPLFRNFILATIVAIAVMIVLSEQYIDIGDVKGTVEKISVRSMQVRHHNGPLHTVPFGEIKYLTNYSRDWVMMKLKLRVTYDTDVEKVRKLIKKLGQQLLEHPEIGDKFLQPLKSQGVLAMEDSAMIIRVKFMTKPGDQFVTRKAVYAAIRELFAKEGIKFAHREVTVRIADDDAPEPHAPDRRRQEAITGAVAPLLEEAAAAPSGGGDDR